MFAYWRRWIWISTIGYAWSRTERLSGFIGVFGTLAVVFLKRLGLTTPVADFLWMPPVFVLASLTVYRLIMAPAILEREAEKRHQSELAGQREAIEEARRETSAALAERDAMAAKLNQRNVLGELLEEASAFLSRHTDTSEEYNVWRTEYLAWRDLAKARISKNLTRADVATFLTPSGTTRHFRLAFDPEHAATLNAIADQVASLERMIERRS